MTQDTPPKIHAIRYTKTTKPKPQEGDRRTTKAHGVQIRVRVRARDQQGNIIGLLSNNGRPVYEWCKPKWLQPWDRHWLTPSEKARYFPPESEPGYMQMRGAA